MKKKYTTSTFDWLNAPTNATHTHSGNRNGFIDHIRSNTFEGSQGKPSVRCAHMGVEDRNMDPVCEVITDSIHEYHGQNSNGEDSKVQDEKMKGEEEIELRKNVLSSKNVYLSLENMGVLKGMRRDTCKNDFSSTGEKCKGEVKITKKRETRKKENEYKDDNEDQKENKNEKEWKKKTKTTDGNTKKNGDTRNTPQGFGKATTIYTSTSSYYHIKEADIDYYHAGAAKHQWYDHHVKGKGKSKGKDKGKAEWGYRESSRGAIYYGSQDSKESKIPSPSVFRLSPEKARRTPLRPKDRLNNEYYFATQELKKAQLAVKQLARELHNM